MTGIVASRIYQTGRSWAWRPSAGGPN